jgi:hypothetical protein
MASAIGSMSAIGVKASAAGQSGETRCRSGASIRSLQSKGHESLRAVAAVLNERGIPTARGGAVVGAAGAARNAEQYVQRTLIAISLSRLAVPLLPRPQIRVITRRSFGFRTFKAMPIAICHTLGRLPEPESAHRF